MAACKKLRKLLDEKDIKYVTLSHSRAFTSQEIAATMHVSGNVLAKSVIVKDNGDLSMVVLPANFKINFDDLKKALDKKEIQLASERNFTPLFEECEAGAMCPFGGMYDIPVFITKSIADKDEIVFNAGTHTDAIKMPMGDFMNIVQPKILKISEPIWPKRL
ncbi:MAG: YbaK/EbsC family protein [bacterium]|nr:YbaK/EbsC family protein [bacterium]